MMASMGPRQFRRGEPPPRHAVCCQVSRFNGATAISPWRTSLSNTDLYAGCEMLQWGHGNFAVENSATTVTIRDVERRFNGATAISPWRTGRHNTGTAASRGFNGATAISPWR